MSARRSSASRPVTARPIAARPEATGSIAIGAIPAVVACALAALLLLTLIDRRESGDEPGASASGDGNGIHVREATLRRTPTHWRLDAQADIELSPAIRSGLDSGVPLEFVLSVSLREPRRFAPDRTWLDVERRYALVYYDLTRHYRVRSLDDGTARNYRSLGTALDGLGTLSGVPLGLPDANVPTRHDGRALVGRVSLRLDGRALPLPLQSPFGSAWRLSSRAHVWTLPDGDRSTVDDAGGEPGSAGMTHYRELRS